MTLTRAEFEAACKALLLKHDTSCIHDNSGINHDLKRFPVGWTWHEHDSYPGLGYLARSVSLPGQHSPMRTVAFEDLGDAVIEGEDDAMVLTGSTPELLTCRQYVVYSTTYQVPALYFSVHRSNGAVLTLAEIMSAPLFRKQVFPETQTAHGIDASESSFALLSQGDHPILGTPCWYLHPCHTAEVMGEIMDEVEVDKSERARRYLEAWFMVLGNMISWG